MKRLLLLGTLGTVVAACVRPLPTLPRQPAAAELFSAPVQVEPAGMDDPAAPAFTLAPGDQLRVRMLSIEPLELATLQLDATGSIYLPLCGRVALGGATIDEASARIDLAFHAFDRYARTSLEVTEARGHQATVVGAVEHPGVHTLLPLTRLSELLALSGGPRVFTAEGEAFDMADLDGARVVRGGATLPVSLRLALEGTPRHNVRVLPGDLLVVPPSHGQRISMLGEVRTPRALPFRRGLRLSEALTLAGGPTADANQMDIRVIRGPLSAPRVYQTSFSALLDGRGHDAELAPGDIVFVTQHWLATIGQVVNRISPLLGAVALTVGLVR